MNRKWRFGARLNSFKHCETTSDPSNASSDNALLGLLRDAARVNGLTDVELNYPQHFSGHSIADIEATLHDTGLNCNGVALRFDEHRFLHGDLTHPDIDTRRQAIDLVHKAAEHCQALGGLTLTFWSAHDGTDYPFQADYEELWSASISGLRSIAQEFPSLNISIEYKPYQPRAFSVFADLGLVLTAIKHIGLPNVGVTLDYCHMLMKKENPTASLALAHSDGALFGVHLNDGYQHNDDGMIAGSVHLTRFIEFVYYLRKIDYDGLVYFDTFPERNNAIDECQANIDTFLAANTFIDRVGEHRFSEAIASRDPLMSQQLIIDLLNGSRNGDSWR